VTKELDQAVADKKLTSAQRDKTLTAFKDGLDDLVNGKRTGPVLGGPRGGLGIGIPGLGLKLGRGGALDAAAGALGLKLGDLLSKLRSGQSVADIAKANNKSLDDVKAAVTTAVTKELDRAVADQKLTSAQRDKLLNALKSHLDDLLTRSLPKGIAAGPRGFKGHWR
jgi:uncharacterized coiled-coil protein SlyX